MQAIRDSAARPKIKKGDTVQVISGREKGKSGKILEVRADKHQVFVEKLNMIKRHQRPTQKQRQGGIIEREGPLNWSNVLVVCAACGKPTKIGSKQLNDGSKIRMCKKCGEALDKS